jgi:CRP-like cAMP-binding protein
VQVSEGSLTQEQNRLLALLPQQEYTHLLPNLELVSLDFKQVLYERERPMQYVYFPLSGVVSSIDIMRDGSGVPVASVGKEGMVGVRAFLGADAAPRSDIVQVPGQALRLPVLLLRSQAGPGGSLPQILCRYVNAFLGELTQSVACHLLHPLEKRCCRWLLMTHDRMGSDRFPLTHGLLAEMLGVRRASVTEVARKLQKAGLIDYIHGKITVLNRRGLEAAACECYEAVKKDFTLLLGGP